MKKIILILLCLFSGMTYAYTDIIKWGPYTINGNTYYDAFEFNASEVSTVSANGPTVATRGHLNNTGLGIFFWGPINEHFCRDEALTDCPYGYDSIYTAVGNGASSSVPISASSQDVYD